MTSPSPENATPQFLYTDGGCDGSGIGGWSWILADGEREVERRFGGPYYGTTNQRMEMYACVLALQTLAPTIPIHIVSDSAYLVNCFNDGWYTRWRSNGWKARTGKPVENRDLWEILLFSIEHRLANVTFEHVKGHDGHVWNEEADKLATYARLTAYTLSRHDREEAARQA